MELNDFYKFILIILVVILVIMGVVFHSFLQVQEQHEIELNELKQENKAVQDSLKQRIKDVEHKWDAIDEIGDKIQVLAPKIKEKSKIRLSFFINHYGKRYPILQDMLLDDVMTSIPAVESVYYKYAVGNIGEIGYYQINPIHLKQFTPETIHLAYDENFQVWTAYEILMRNFKVFNAMDYALNSYNGWASLQNPYYGKIQNKMDKICNI